MPILMYSKDHEETTNLCNTKVANVELDEKGFVTIYFDATEHGECYYIVLTREEFEEVKNPFDLSKPDGA